MKKMPYCPICEIKFKDRRGLTGHFRFKHRIEYKTGKPAKETPLTRAVRESIERHVSGGAVMKAIEEEKRSEQEEEWSEGINLKGLKGSEGVSLKGLSGRWYENGER